MVCAYLRELLVEEHGDELEVLEDGGYLVPVAGGVRVWVVDGNHRSRRVLVTAPVLDAEASPELLAALNELNAATPYGRYFHLGDEVIVEDTVLAEELQPSALSNAIGFVAWAAENGHGFLADELELGEPEPGGPHDPSAPNEVELQDLTQPLGARPAHAADRGTDGVVNAGGYL
jgi:hypothetical protein